LFRRQLQYDEFDVSELGISAFIGLVSKGDTRYVGLPVFTSRMFRRAYIFVNSSSDIHEPRDLRGKKIGIPQYEMSAALYVRGFLHDDYGVTPDELLWFESASRTGDGGDRRPTPPPGVHVTSVGDASLSDMLVDGNIDALITAAPPPAYRRGDRRIRRLFHDPYGDDIAAYARTEVFPIMHLMVIRRSLHDQYPWLARNITNAFGAAKRNAFDRMQDDGHSISMLPLFRKYWEDTRAMFGEDFWPYGVGGNLRSLEAALRYSHSQGLSDRLVAVDELFFEGAGNTFGAY
jgi:4,5-dihydroxyphthalate decarboxylase